MARVCARVFPRRVQGCRVCMYKFAAEGACGPRRSGVTGKSACAARVNKADSPRISEDIHIDRKQPLGVSLKGSSLQVLATCGLDENPGWSTGKSACATRQKSLCPQRAKS